MVGVVVTVGSLRKNSKTWSSLNFLQSGPQKFSKSDFFGLSTMSQTKRVALKSPKISLIKGHLGDLKATFLYYVSMSFWVSWGFWVTGALQSF